MWLTRESVSAKKNSLNAACIQAAVIATFFITACSLENRVHAARITTVLGDKITLNCSTNQLSEEITMVKWSRSIGTVSKDIIAYSAIHRLHNFLKDDRLSLSSSDGTGLQIQPVNLTDEGNYTCEISAAGGVFRDHISLFIIVPPVIMLNVSILPNGHKKFQCIASKGKPAATIAWKENTVGNSTYILINNDDGTVTVESQFITAINFTKEEQVCIINHPAFNEMQNHTISIDIDTKDDTRLISLQLLFTLITCVSAIALGMVMLMICMIKKKRAAPARITDNTQMINLSGRHSGRRKQHRTIKDPIYQNTYHMKRYQQCL
ncbi:cell surface glycoprotein CD200 receptor 5-like [Pristis pectinata]|uniref:cell surface glycoprotein CD200 receptor 5-like n=1 Tax=Pristis pectinata TaxID=685728 RepID=UPI00223CC62B|nr:cell surface glycoprotein CD200 receptor 5-like [Pristis pectinata]